MDLRDLLASALGDTDVEFAETHVSLLAFSGDRVLKAKKPVVFDFIDLSTPEKRLAVCEREVALNRRLAPDVYSGVVALRDERGEIVDHAVEMRRLPAAHRLSTLVREGAAVERCLDELAGRLARFHAAAARSPEIDACATRDAVADLWEHGFRETRPFVGSVLPGAIAAVIEDDARRYLAGRDALFARRIAGARVCDGHGDLLADDIFCLDDGVRAIDCLEFDDRLRAGDGLADAAFLAMDLEHLGRADLGRSFLAAYARAAGDEWPRSLEHHYVAYRAHVRAKVAALRHAQGDVGAAPLAATFLTQCADHLARGRVRIVLVGGLPGTGKSTLARALGDALGWEVLRSDVVRKDRAGLAAETRAAAPLDSGLYSEAATEATYEALGAAARDRASRGCSVVLDASWSSQERRRSVAAVARETCSTLVALACTAPRDVALARIAARALEGRDASDATREVRDAMARRFDTWPDARAVDMSTALAASLAVALAAVGPA